MSDGIDRVVDGAPCGTSPEVAVNETKNQQMLVSVRRKKKSSIWFRSTKS
jgi:hypothetical protein